MNMITAPAKKFWNNNKGAIAVVGVVTAVAATALVVRNQKITNNFLEQHGLLTEFYKEIV